MMKLIAFFLMAIVALVSAGGGPEVYSAVTTQQVHGPWASSTSSRVQQFNDVTYVAPVVSAPVVSAPVVSAPVAYSAKVVAPVAYSSYGYSDYGYGYYH